MYNKLLHTITNMLTKLRLNRRQVKYRLFVLERKWQLHPVLKYFRPLLSLITLTTSLSLSIVEGPTALTVVWQTWPRRIAVMLIAFGLTAAGFFTYLQLAQADWYSTSWLYRKPITIDHTKVGEDHTDFPVLVAITDTSLKANAQSSGGDILFTSDNGTTKLSHEIESYDSTTGKLLAWVKVPALSSSTDTVINMYYGNPSAASQQDADTTWDSTYKAVYHMSEDPSVVNCTSNKEVCDTSGNANNADSNGSMTNTDKVAGQVGYGIDFDNTDDFLQAPHSTTLQNATNMTISGWIYWRGGNDYILEKGANDTSDSYAWIMDPLSPDINYFEFNDSGGTYRLKTESPGGALVRNGWNYVSIVYDDTNNLIKMFRNGVEIYSAASAQSLNQTYTSDLYIGKQNNAGFELFFGGIIDELHIQGTARSLGWATTEYNNQSDPGSFYTVGAQQQKKQPVLYWKFDEGGGTTASDTSGRGNPGVISGATYQNKDICLFEGGCLKFDGLNDSVQRTYNADTDLAPSTNSFSVGAWFRHPTSFSGTDTIIARTDAVAGVGYKLYYSDTTGLCFGIDNAAGSFPSDAACHNTSFADNQWHYVEAVKNGTTSIKLYVDGKEKATDSSITGSSISGANPTFSVGIDVDGTTNPWDGYLDEIKVYDYARSAAEVQADYNAKGSALGASISLGGIDPKSALSNGLVGYWKLDDGVGNACSSGVDKACDSSGNSNVGTWTNGAASTSGKFGFGVNFDGTNDFIKIPTPSAVNNTGSKMSMGAWFKTSNKSSEHQIISISNASSTGVQLYVENGTGYLVGWSSTGNQFRYNTDVADGAWHHAFVTFDGTNGTLYFDGKQVAQAPRTFAANTLDAQIGTQCTGAGSTSCSSYFQGQIDDVRVYNRTLSPREVTTLADWAPGPVGHWKLDERSGTTAYDAGSLGNNGTLVNTKSNPWIPGKYGGGINFDAINDSVDVPDNNAYSVTTNNTLTVECWIKLDSLVNDFVDFCSKGAPPTSYEWSLRADGTTSKMEAMIHTPDGATSYMWTQSNTTIQVGRWYHVAMVVDLSSPYLKLYLNGVLESTDTGTSGTAPTNGTAALTIGERADNSFDTDGTVDDVRIYNYARTSKQVTQDMNAGHPAVGSPIASALLHLKFDDGFGNVASNSGSCGATCNASLFNMANPAINDSGWTNEGKIGKALRFDGSNDFSSILDSPALSGTHITVSSWINFARLSNGGSWQFMAGKEGSWLLDENEIANHVTWWVKVGSTWYPVSVPNSKLSTNRWFHFVGTYDGETAILYVDGKEVGRNSTPSGDLPDTAMNLALGRDLGGSSSFFRGALDEFKIYNYALNANEVKVDYNNGKGIVLGSLSTDPNGKASNSAARSYCPPGNSETNCAGGNLNPGPIGEWRFEEAMGTIARDTSGNGFNGVLTNTTPKYTSGKLGKGFNFAGIAGYFDITDTPVLRPSNITVEAWIKPTNVTASFQNIVVKGWPNNGSWNFYLENDDLVFGLENSGGTEYEAVFPNVIRPNEWQHVIGTFDGTNVKVYVNGIKGTDSPTVGGSGFLSHTNNMIIGDTGNQFSGIVDEVRIFNYARTQAQNAWSYNRGQPFARYKFDECTGSTIYNSASPPIATLAASLTYATRYGTSGGNTSSGTCDSGVGTEAWANGKNGKFNSALDFDGVDDRVMVSDNNFGNFGTGQFTASFWVSADAGNGAIIMKDNVAGTGNGIFMYARASTATYGYWNGSTTYEIGARNSGWHHVVAVREGTGANQMKFYYDGRPAGTGTDSRNLSNGINLRFGTEADQSTFLDGRLDDLMLFNYALTPAQIKVLYNQNSAVRFAPITGRPQ